MSEDETKLAATVGAHADRSVDAARNESTRQSRRGLIKTGAILLPAVLTLRATPAWAQTDYTTTAYRYGTNAGLCKNANFNANAAPDSAAGQEFLPCPDVTPRKPTRTNSTGSDETRHFDR
jgi:hypothetical protein